MFFPRCPCCGNLITIRQLRDSDGGLIWSGSRGIYRGTTDPDWGRLGYSGSRAVFLNSEGYDYDGEVVVIDEIGHPVTAGNFGNIVRWQGEEDGFSVLAYGEDLAPKFDSSIEFASEVSTLTGNVFLVKAGPRAAILNGGYYWLAGNATDGLRLQAYDPANLEAVLSVLIGFDYSTAAAIAPNGDGVSVICLDSPETSPGSQVRGHVSVVDDDGSLPHEIEFRGTVLPGMGNNFGGTEFSFLADNRGQGPTLSRTGCAFLAVNGSIQNVNGIPYRRVRILGTDADLTVNVDIDLPDTSGGTVYLAADVDTLYVLCPKVPTGTGMQVIALDLAGMELWRCDVDNGHRLVPDYAGSVFVETLSFGVWGVEKINAGASVFTLPLTGLSGIQRVLTVGGSHYLCGLWGDAGDRKQVAKVSPTGSLDWEFSHGPEGTLYVQDAMKVDDAIWIVGDPSSHATGHEDDEEHV